MKVFAARILTDIRKYDHISPIVRELGWLAVQEQLCLHDSAMIYKCLNGLTPSSEAHEYNTSNRD